MDEFPVVVEGSEVLLSIEFRMSFVILSQLSDSALISLVFGQQLVYLLELLILPSLLRPTSSSVGHSDIQSSNETLNPSIGTLELRHHLLIVLPNVRANVLAYLDQDSFDRIGSRILRVNLLSISFLLRNI